MSQIEEQIGNEIYRIARRVGERDGVTWPIMTGKVKGYNEAENTVSVLFTGSANPDNADVVDSIHGDITNNVTLENMSGVYMVPAIDSDCLVMNLDSGGMYELIKASSYSQIVIKASSGIQFNDGKLGGLTKTLELQKQLNKLNTLVSHLLQVITSAPIAEPGSGAPSALQAAFKLAVAADTVGDFSKIENTNIKQG